MRKRSTTERLNPTQEDDDEQEEDKGKGFFACYLLTSLCPRFKGHTYIGFTVNPRRRIRQHNGEIRSGAFRTKKRRPWEMVFCIYGFPTNVSALQFEWAWQHPMESLAVRQAAATFKSFSGIANKIKLAYTMLNLPAWQSLNITVNYFSTKYSMLSASCPSLPTHMKVQVCPIDELPCYLKTGESSFECQDAEDGFDDNEKYASPTVRGIEKDKTVDVQSHPLDELIKKEKTVEVQSHPLDELLCLNRREENAYEASDGVCCITRTANRNVLDTINHVFSDNLHSIEATSEESISDEEYITRQPSLTNISADYPSSPEVDHVQHFNFIASLPKTSHSLYTGFPANEAGNGDIMILTNTVSELESRNGKMPTSENDKDKSIPPEIEVIDLLSPSPECRIMSSRKKRRIITVCPQIIDLT